MLKHGDPETGFPDLWSLRGYWAACFERDPNVNEYGVPVDDWDELSQNQQRDIAHEHGDDWHGQPAPAQDDDDGGSSRSASTETSTNTSTSGAMPDFKTGAEQEDWLAEQRQKQWDDQERGFKQNVEKGRKDWEEQVREREERLRGEGRHDAAGRLRDELEAQREQWDQEHDTSQDAGDRARRDYIDRPLIDRDTRIQQYQDADTNPERREMREALADMHPQSPAEDIEYQIWYNWAWEDAPPPSSAGPASAAPGPNAIPLFSESLDPMEKVGWETGAEYLERIAAVQRVRDQLSQERWLRESRGDQQFPGESDADFQARRAAMGQGPTEAPQSALGYSLEQLNAQGLGPAEYAAALERLSRDPWFHGIAYDQERDWLTGKADFYRSVGQTIAIGQTGTGADLDAAIEALERLSRQPAITPQQLEYLEQVINSHERARETVTAARESAIEAWEGKVLGNINAFGDPDAKAEARAVLDDDALTGEERRDALARIEAQAFVGAAHQANLAAWEGRVLGNINTFGSPEAKARAQAVLGDGALTGKERRDALAKIQDQAWEGKVLGNINTFGSPEAKARAQAVLGDGALTGKERRDALVKIQDQAWEEIEKHNEEVEQEARDLAISLDWDPDARGGRPELTPWEHIQKHNEEVEQEARDLAISLDWDPDARGGRPELTPWEHIQKHNEEVEQEARDLAISLDWDPDARGGRPELTPWEHIQKHNEEVEQEARDLAISLNWDPDARGGRPELTPWEYIEKHNEEVEREARDLAISLNWDPDARGGRPEFTPWEYIQKHNEEVAAENLALAIERGYLPEGPERTPMTPEGYLRQLQVEAYGTATRNEAEALEDQAVIASGSLEEQVLTAAYNRWFQELTGVEPTGNQAQDRALLRHAASQQLFSGFGGDDLAIDDEARFREEQSVAFRRSFETRQKLGDVNRLEDLRTASSEGSLSPGDVIRIDFVDGQSIVLDPAEPFDQKAFGDATTIFRDDPEMLRRMYDYAAQYGHVRPYVPQPGDDSERARAFQSAAADAAQIPLVPRSVLLTPHGRLLAGLPMFMGMGAGVTAAPGIAAISGAASGGLATVAPTDPKSWGGSFFVPEGGAKTPESESWGEFTRRDWQRFLHALPGGIMEGPVGYGAGRGVFALGGRFSSGFARSPWGIPVLTNVGETAADLGFAATLDGSGIQQHELGPLALGAGMGFTGDVTSGAWRPIAGTLPAAYSVLAKQPWAPTLEQPGPIRFSGFGYASAKPLEQRAAELDTYLDSVNMDVAMRFPDHWREVLRASGGQGYTIDNMNLRRPLEQENIDVVEFLKARTAMAGGLAEGRVTTAPTLSPGVVMVGRPTPWQTQRRGGLLHGSYDVTPFLKGGKLPALESLVQRGLPGKLGLFGSDRAIAQVLDRPFDVSQMRTGPREELRPGFLELPGSELVLPPKLSPQDIGRATPISIRLMEQLGDSGPIIRPETGPPATKRHRATAIPVNEEGRVLLVKGRKDNVWMLPGGDVKPTETVVEAGQRELAEETGLRSTEGERTFSLDADTTFHDVSVLPVRGDSTPKELQAKELQDYMWWDGETALPLSRSTRTILKEYMGAEPPRTGSSQVLEGREAYDWWPSQPSLAEVEAVFPVGGRRQGIDRSLSRPVLGGARPEGTVPPALYLAQGADPVTRRQIALANLLQLLIQARLRKPPGLTFESDLPSSILSVGRVKAAAELGGTATFRDARLPGETGRSLDTTHTGSQESLRGQRDQGETGDAPEIAPAFTSPNRVSDDGLVVGSVSAPLHSESPLRSWDARDTSDGDTRAQRREPQDREASTDPPARELIDPPTEPPTDPTTGELIDPPTEPPTDPTTGELIDPPTEPPPEPPAGALIDPPTEPPTDPTAGELIDPPTEPPTDPTAGELIDPPTEPPTDPTTGELIDPPTEPPPEPPAGALIDPPTEPPTDPTAGELIDPPTEPPPDPPAGELIDPPRDTPEDPRRRRKHRGDGQTEQNGKQRLPLRSPKKVRFQTVEEVEVDLEDGDTTRTPVGNRPAESLKVVEHGDLPYPEQHYVGRITDVLTDEKGHPYIAQKPQYQGRRPLGKQSITPMSERDPEERAKVRHGLQKEIAEAEAAGAKSQRRRTGGGGQQGAGMVSPAPGPSSTGGGASRTRFGGRTTADRFMRTRKLKAK